MLPESLKDCYLDHIAIVVESLDSSIQVYENLGLSFSKEREVVEDQGVKTAFAHVDQNAHIELLEPFGENGPIHKYLEKKGPGIHHLCFRVPNIEQKSLDLKEKGFVLLYEQAKMGANHCLVNFIHPKSTGGVLIEISEKLKD